jgi:hypothetical protein
MHFNEMKMNKNAVLAPAITKLFALYCVILDNFLILLGILLRVISVTYSTFVLELRVTRRPDKAGHVLLFDQN